MARAFVQWELKFRIASVAVAAAGGSGGCSRHAMNFGVGGNSRYYSKPQHVHMGRKGPIGRAYVDSQDQCSAEVL